MPAGSPHTPWASGAPWSGRAIPARRRWPAWSVRSGSILETFGPDGSTPRSSTPGWPRSRSIEVPAGRPRAARGPCTDGARVFRVGMQIAMERANADGSRTPFAMPYHEAIRGRARTTRRRVRGCGSRRRSPSGPARSSPTRVVYSMICRNVWDIIRRGSASQSARRLKSPECSRAKSSTIRIVSICGYRTACELEAMRDCCRISRYSIRRSRPIDPVNPVDAAGRRRWRSFIASTSATTRPSLAASPGFTGSMGRTCGARYIS